MRLPMTEMVNIPGTHQTGAGREVVDISHTLTLSIDSPHTAVA
jgi:hypothetical protein